MISEKQHQANCRNAQKSSGPSSVEGKAVSSRNALKSGLYAKTLVVYSESQEEFESLKAEFYRQYQPATPQARLILDRLIANNWLLRRFDFIEHEIWQREVPQFDSIFRDDRFQPFAQAFHKVGDSYARLRRFVNSVERAIERQIKLLKDPAINTEPGDPASAQPEPLPAVQLPAAASAPALVPAVQLPSTASAPAPLPPVQLPAAALAPAPQPGPARVTPQSVETTSSCTQNGFVSSNSFRPAQPRFVSPAQSIAAPQIAPVRAAVNLKEAS